MRSHQRGADGKSRVLFCKQIWMKRTESILETEQTPVNLPRGEASKVYGRDYCCEFETLAAFSQKEKQPWGQGSQKAKVTFFFFSLPVCLLKLQSAQDVNRLQELSRWQHCYKLLRLQFFSTTELHKTVSSLHSLTEVHPVWVIRYEKQKPLECHKKKKRKQNSCICAITVTAAVGTRCLQIRGMVL